ncbi:mannose-6-phosphate isomerase [Anaeramoeba ignava]|uniref:mannose-6-phosphate isomerase n=1 Tax=Anaeramoeba ignava TaxID=1746090 RepID=A0A9Q0RGR6_ANAIG|nr:mannose-6-phosphate isomerase [Anaeramoeba ignava]
MNKIYSMKCVAQNYAWGKQGQESLVAKLWSLNNNKEITNNKEPFAEFWMGDHPNGPSKIMDSNSKEIEFEEWIEKNKEKTGEEILEFNESRNNPKNQLPFLFKVLSINKTLSIQAHPDRELAQKLHKNYPDIYKDPNHKPELAIAISGLEAIMGFKPLQQINQNIQNFNYLQNVIDGNAANQFSTVINDPNSDENQKSQVLKLVFSSLLNCSDEVIKNQLENMKKEIESKIEKGIEISDEEKLAIKLNTQFPNDSGAFLAFFMNHLFLQKGECVFIKENICHAYISGDIIECMARSDNVVRAGLTPKFQDKKTLIEMLDYSPSQNSKIQKPKQIDSFVSSFEPSFEEFIVHQISVPKNQLYSYRQNQNLSILLVLFGSANISLSEKIDSNHDLSFFKIKQGDVFLIPAKTQISFQTEQESITCYSVTLGNKGEKI